VNGSYQKSGDNQNRQKGAYAIGEGRGGLWKIPSGVQTGGNIQTVRFKARRLENEKLTSKKGGARFIEIGSWESWGRLGGILE